MMTDTIRCPACRGSKRVAKLGGVIGECNMCKGLGTILEADKPRAVVQMDSPLISELVKAVADSIPVSTIDTKVNGKKALYKRKSA